MLILACWVSCLYCAFSELFLCSLLCLFSPFSWHIPCYLEFPTLLLSLLQRVFDSPRVRTYILSCEHSRVRGGSGHVPPSIQKSMDRWSLVTRSDWNAKTVYPMCTMHAFPVFSFPFRLIQHAEYTPYVFFYLLSTRDYHPGSFRPVVDVNVCYISNAFCHGVR